MKVTTYEDMTQVEVVNQMFGLTLVVSIFYIDGLLIDTGAIKKKAELIPLFQMGH